MKRVKGAAVGAPLSSPASMGTGSLPSGDERQPIESTQPLPTAADGRAVRPSRKVLYTTTGRSTRRATEVPAKGYSTLMQGVPRKYPEHPPQGDPKCGP